MTDFDPGRLKSVPSPEDIEEGRTPAGGFTRLQLAQWGVPWPPPTGWRRALHKEYAERIREEQYR